MGRNPDNSTGYVALPRWFINLCRWTWLLLSRFFFLIIIGLVLNILATILSTNSFKLVDTPLGWLIQHSVLIGILGFVLVMMAIMARLVSLYPVAPREKEVEQLYYKYIEHLTKQWAKIYFPNDFSISDSQLDDMYVDLRFWPDKVSRGEPQSSKDKVINFLPQQLFRSIVPTITSAHDYFFPGRNLGLLDMWQEMTSEQPARIILGGPGSGKTSLLYHLALKMANQGQRGPNIHKSDDIKPSLIPIIVKLRDYAEEYTKYSDTDLSLTNYLKIIASRLYIPDLASFFEKSLMEGTCLIMLDGLDEVYDLRMRDRIEGAISTFVVEKCIRTTKSTNFNRLLVTSRLMGYNLQAFPDYRHCTIAELGREQILDFVRKRLSESYKESMSKVISEIEKQRTIERETRDLISLLEHDREFQPLMKNPLSLTLLINMRWKGSPLPRCRVDVYQSFLQMISASSPTTSKEQLLYLLEALAFQMQENEKTQMSRIEIEKVLNLELQRKSRSLNLDKEITKNFLRDVQERIGIFVEQEPDSYRFLHRTFQEYMVACFICDETESGNDWLAQLIGKVRHANTLWREPFILATACLSKNNVRAARRMIETLIDLPRDSSSEDQLQDLNLAVDCLIEAEPLAIDKSLESKIAEKLLITYGEVKQQQNSEAASQIEDIIHRWLDNGSGGIYPPALLMVLYDAIKDELHPYRRELSNSLLKNIGWTEDRLQMAIQEDEYILTE